jgi:hypothetical protein
VKIGDVDCVRQGLNQHWDDVWQMGPACLEASRGSGICHVCKCLVFVRSGGKGKNSTLGFAVIESVILLQKF